MQAARREFREETGYSVDGDFTPLKPLRQPGGKWVYAFALEGDCEAGHILSNTCEVQWPPRSGRYITIPEVDRAAWLSVSEAREKLLHGQLGFLDELIGMLSPQARH